jgi:hypothetical protein
VIECQLGGHAPVDAGKPTTSTRGHASASVRAELGFDLKHVISELRDLYLPGLTLHEPAALFACGLGVFSERSLAGSHKFFLSLC